MEIISEEHNNVWRILDRGKYNQEDADNIEKMYNIMECTRDILGEKMMQFFDIYGTLYTDEFLKIVEELAGERQEDS